MAIRHFCDRCGKQIPPNAIRTYIRPVDQDGDPLLHGPQKEYELCLECREKLEAFLTRDTKEDWEP